MRKDGLKTEGNYSKLFSKRAVERLLPIVTNISCKAQSFQRSNLGEHSLLTQALSHFAFSQYHCLMRGAFSKFDGLIFEKSLRDKNLISPFD